MPAKISGLRKCDRNHNIDVLLCDECANWMQRYGPYHPERNGFRTDLKCTHCGYRKSDALIVFVRGQMEPRPRTALIPESNALKIHHNKGYIKDPKLYQDLHNYFTHDYLDDIIHGITH